MAEYCHNLFRLNMLVVLGFCQVLELSDLHAFRDRIKHLQCTDCSPVYMVDSSIDESPVLVYLSLGIDT